MTLEVVSLWSLGALFGLRHALEPDHLAAVSTLIVGRPSPRAALGLGVAWGIGHTLALVAVASVLAAARATLPATLGAWCEVAVGAMLVVLGVQAVRRALSPVPVAVGVGVSVGVSVGVNVGAILDAPVSRAGWSPARRSLLVGTVHGLAGSGALTALIAAQFPSVAGRVAYVGIFGVGSLVGMATLSGLAGVPLGRASRRPAFRRLLGITAGAGAITLGILWGGREIRWLVLAAGLPAA